MNQIHALRLPAIAASLMTAAMVLVAACSSTTPSMNDEWESDSQALATCSLSVTKNVYIGRDWWGTIVVKNTTSTRVSGVRIAFDIPKGVKCDYAAKGWSYSQTGVTCVYTTASAVIAAGASLTFNYSTNSQAFSAAKNVQAGSIGCTTAPAPTPAPTPTPDAGTPAPTPTPDAGTPAVDSGSSTLQWRRANLTHYTSYPDPGSEECVKYNGCTWAGQFAALSGKQPESWVKANNIAAVHSKDFAAYKLKTLRLRQGTREIDVKVYDMCADSDCSGCCTANSSQTGFLIDIESYTAARFGSGSGIVEWACVDCK